MSDLEDEIVRHHRVIERWLSGAADPAEFEALASAHALDFTWIATDGSVRTATETLNLIEGAHGSAPGLTIEIAAVVPVDADSSAPAAAFLERQPDGDRWVTVIFTREGTGLRWRHLQETLVAPTAPDTASATGEAPGVRSPS
jgi:hypothetical protein